jgi:4-alpha-glucanotransferase
MTDQNRPNSEIAGFDSLAELALDLRRSWNHATDGLWMTLSSSVFLRKAGSASTRIVTAQDLLDLGSDARMNFPGIEQGNWQWRLKHGVLTGTLRKNCGA